MRDQGTYNAYKIILCRAPLHQSCAATGVALDSSTAGQAHATYQISPGHFVLKHFVLKLVLKLYGRDFVLKLLPLT